MTSQMAVAHRPESNQSYSTAPKGFQGIDTMDARILMFTHESPRRLLTIATILGIPLMECSGRIKRLILMNLLGSFRLSLNPSNPEKKRLIYDFHYANTKRVRIVVKGNGHKVQISLAESGENVLLTPRLPR
ncbi:MAG: hypothetical protein LN417_00650 [Candidatus Thermoplasmatota archaeon]|nr:hypothetical protein [Candidatus Thermoplasmatota archaeon]